MYSSTQISKRNLKHIIASMDIENDVHSYKYDSKLRKLGANPEKLRGMFYSKCKSVNGIYDYMVTENTEKHDRFESDIPINEDRYIHTFNNQYYMGEDIPVEGPEYFTSGITKMYALGESIETFNNIYIINFDTNSGQFSYVLASIIDSRWSGFHHRTDLNWQYSDEENLDFVSLYEDYSNIIKDFIDDSRVGAIKILKYINCSINSN